MAVENVQRRLAAIMAADVVGYSRLMEADEAGTLERLKDLRRELFEPRTKQRGGRIFKTTGDGALVEFRSAADAVKCAVDIQNAVSARETGVAADRRIALRIGISLGDVIVEGGDLYGNGVNVAARMEGLADPGGICISGNVHEHVQGEAGLAFDDLGEQQVKNLDGKVRAWRVALGATAGSSEAAAPRGPARTEQPGIAVLPFDNMSGDPEQDYFADGMVEEIITGLARIRWLTVIARNSTFSYKGQAPDVRKVGRDLAVRYVLEGSVRKAGDRVRITAQLVEAETGGHLWSERFDGRLDDVFDLQDRITAAVVGAIEPSVRRAEIDRIKRRRPDNLNAYDLYLRALAHFHQGTGEAYAAALPLLEQALKLDPEFVEAHGLAAAVCWRRHEYQGQRAELADRETALAHARAVRALRADDAESLAHAAQAFLIAGQDADTAFALINQALDHNPNSAVVHTLGAILSTIKHRWEAGRIHAERALELSPRDPGRFRSILTLGFVELETGNIEAALNQARRALQINPDHHPSHFLLIVALMRLGRVEDACSAARSFMNSNPEFRTSRNWSLRINPGYVRELREAGMPE